MRLGTFDFGESEFSVKNREKPQDAGKLEAADLPEHIGNSDIEKIREAGRLEAMGLPEKIDVPPSIYAEYRIDNYTYKEKRDIANEDARRYNEKYHPYERAEQKGDTDVIQTENRGVSSEESEALYVTEVKTDDKEIPESIESGEGAVIEQPDISFIERTSRSALMERCSLGVSESTSVSETPETKSEGLTAEERAKIKEETGWSDEIIDSIQNMKQYEILKNANLVEVEINGRKCLIRSDIDLDKEWNTGKFDADGNPVYETNRERMEDGKPPLDGNGRPIELHHLGQKADSPLVELTVEEHRTGEYEDGKKNQSLWHDNTKETEVHGEGNTWNQERESHWEARSEQTKGGST